MKLHPVESFQNPALGHCPAPGAAFGEMPERLFHGLQEWRSRRSDVAELCRACRQISELSSSGATRSVSNPRISESVKPSSWTRWINEAAVQHPVDTPGARKMYAGRRSYKAFTFVVAYESPGGRHFFSPVVRYSAWRSNPILEPVVHYRVEVCLRLRRVLLFGNSAATITAPPLPKSLPPD